MSTWQTLASVICAAIAAATTMFGALANQRAKRADKRTEIALAQIAERKEVKLKTLDDTGRFNNVVLKSYENAIAQVPELFRLIEEIQQKSNLERMENVARFTAQQSEIMRLSAAETRCAMDLGLAREKIAVLCRDLEALQQATLGTAAVQPRRASSSPALPAVTVAPAGDEGPR